MQSVNDIEIRKRLASYLADEISLQEFEDWFVPVSWNVEKTKNDLAIQLAYEIELRLAEFSSGHRTEDDLRACLRPLVEKYVPRLS